MERLAKVAGDLARPGGSISGLDRQTEETVLNAVAVMFANLNVYGKKWAPVVGQGWLMALRVATDISAEDMVRACGHWIAKEKDFPTPSDVFAWIRARHEDVAKQEWLKAEGERFEREDREEREARNIELFGHPHPTREDWKEFLGDRFVESMLGLAPDPTKTVRPEWRGDSPEDIAEAEEKRQAMREQAASGEGDQ